MSQYYQLLVSKLDTVIHDQKNVFSPYFEKAEKLLGVKRIVIAQAILAYKSLMALETSNKEDDSKWLTYWVVFAAFSVIEFFSDVLLSWFPLYWLAKVAFLVWCSADIPNGGASIIYNRVIRPIFLQHKNKLSGTASNGNSPSSGKGKDN